MRLTTDVLRQIGARRLLLEVVPWLLCRRYVFYTLAISDVAARPCAVSFRLDPVVEGDLDHLAAIRPGFYNRSQIRKRLREGHLAFMGRSQNTIVNIRWVFVGSVYLPYLARRLILGPGDGYLDETYTVPGWRQYGVETTAVVETQRALYERGFRRIICAIAPWNRAPRRVAEALGCDRVGSAGYWNLLGWKKFFCDGGVQVYRNGDLSAGDAGLPNQDQQAKPSA